VAKKQKIPKSLKGYLLIDSGILGGSFFERTVVLICEHNSDGAFGLILNKPSPHRVGELTTINLPEEVMNELVYIGGPVQPQALTYLYTTPPSEPGNVLENLSVGHTIEELEGVAASNTTGRHLKLFAGYSGWAPNQLELELKRKYWLILPATIDLVFEIPAEDLWAVALRRRGDWQSILLSYTPPKVYWN